MIASVNSVANTNLHALPRLRCAIAFTQGIRSIRHLAQILEIDSVLSPHEAESFGGSIVSVLVWGRKQNSQKALHYARERELPVVYLEDGWIRSSAKNAHTRLCYSLLLDETGVYYDSSTPSDIENSLNLCDSEFDHMCTSVQRVYAAKCRADLVAHNITKYNYCSVTQARQSDQPLILVVDQTRDDASVIHGGMQATDFEQMLTAAIDENPAAEVVVRTHPDVVNGRRQGYLAEHAKLHGISVVAGTDNPISAVKLASRVYVGTSQLGYEALLCDRPVTVFGQPFYASWGLTDDRQPVLRRRASRSIDELFHVSHVSQARYCNPVTAQRWQLHECLEHVKLQQRMFAQNAQQFYCSGITPWKRGYVRQYLRSPDGCISFGHTSKVPQEATVTRMTWGFREFSTDESAAVYRMEDGFLRSTGLGSDFSAPASLVVDTRGLYFDPGAPSDLEHLLNNFDCTPTHIKRAVTLKKLILSARLSKYNVGMTGKVTLAPADVRKVLVVGQVEGDQSILRGCAEVNKNATLLEQVRAARSNAWIVYKPHPDVVAGNREGAVAESVLAKCADQVDAESSIIDCIEKCDELHTMTSLSGFEALLRGKKVVTYGAPFYAGWGLTEELQITARRTRRRTLEELIYLSLIEYPRYMDIESGEFTTPEDLVKTINSQRAMNNNNKKSMWSGRQLTKMVNIVRGLRYAP